MHDLNIMILALLAYEYIVTFEREVNLFWRQKITVATVLFMVNRYLALWTSFMNFPFHIPLQASTAVLSRIYHH